MKSGLKVGGLSLATICLAAVIVLWVNRTAKSGRDHAPKQASGPVAVPASATGLGESSHWQDHLEKAATAGGVATPSHPVQRFNDFRDWLNRYNTEKDGKRLAELAKEGEAMARERRVTMAAMIQADPRSAIDLALTPDERRGLPAEVLSQLETPINAMGRLDVMVKCGPQVSPGDAIERYATVDGVQYVANVYGARADLQTKYYLPIHGVAIDNQLAISDSPVRRLDPQEVVDNGFPAGALVLNTGRGLIQAQHEDDAFAITAQLLQQELAMGPWGGMATAAFGATGVDANQGLTPFPPVPNYTFGSKKLLVMLVDFSDSPGALTNAAAVQNVMTSVNQFYMDNSGNQANIQTTVVPQVLRMPQTKAFYATNVNTALRNDAITNAAYFDITNQVTQNQGVYNPTNYDFDTVAFTTIGGTNFNWVGFSFVGAKGMWINGEFDLSVVAHELGHNFGSRHANTLVPPVGSVNPVDLAATHKEYGDDADIMGSNTNGVAYHFNEWTKAYFGWIPAAGVLNVTQPGVYRLFRHDTFAAAGIRALTLGANATNAYWLGYRRFDTEFPLVTNGLQVRWGNQTNGILSSVMALNGSELLNMNPAVTNFSQSALPINQTFGDRSFFITPLDQGGSFPNEYIDVNVSFSISPPAIVQNPASTNVVIGTTNVTFSVTATGNAPLSYQWYFTPTNALNPTNPAPVPINFQILPTLSLSNPTTNQSGFYTVTVGNGGGTLTSAAALLTVSPPPTPPFFTLTPAPFIYEITNSYTTNMVTNVVNGTNMIVTNVTTFFFTNQLVNELTNQFTNQITLYTGTNTSFTNVFAALGKLANFNTTNLAFTATAGGSVPLTYQWQYNGTNIAGTLTNTTLQTNSTFALTNLSITNFVTNGLQVSVTNAVPFTTNFAGLYRLVVTNQFGTTNFPINLSVVPLVAPVITLNPPTNQSLAAGGSLTLTAAVAGTSTPQYPMGLQWLYNNGQIPGATNTTLVLTNLLAGSSGNYQLLVTNLVGTNATVADVVTVTNAQAPFLTSQPSGLSAFTGSTVSFSVTAGGSPPLFYQWFGNGIQIPFGTGPTLSLTNLTLGSAGPYFVVVSNIAGTINSAAVQLNVSPSSGPVITQQPQPIAVSVGSSATFSVTATSSSPLNYQWLFNTTTILAGQTNLSLTLPSVATNQQGGYSVIVSNSLGVVTSAVANLAVSQFPVQPSFITQPQNSTVLAGANATFSATLGGTSPFTYQWIYNNSPLGGATNLSLVITNVTTAQGGIYVLRVDNLAGTAFSTNAILTVVTPPLITTQPTNLTVTNATLATFSVGVNSPSTPGFQWQLNGTNVIGVIGTNATLNIPNAGTNRAGSYTVIVTNLAGSVVSSPAILTVLISPSVSGQPTNTVAAAGSTAVINAGIVGFEQPTFQWFSPVNFGSTVAVPEVLDYTFEEQALGLNFTVVHDYSPSHLDGTLNPTLLTFASTPLGGLGGVSLSLPIGQSAYFGTPDNGALTLSNRFTVEAAFSPYAGSPAGEQVILQRAGSSPSGFSYALLYEAGTNQVKFAIADASGNQASVLTFAPFDSLSHHYAGEVLNGVLSLYIDGVLKATTNTVFTASPAPSQGVYFGANSSGGSQFNGTIDRIRITATNLSASQFFIGPPVAAFGDPAVPNQTGPSLIFNNVSPGQSGPYYVVATNSQGSVTSSIANLKVLLAPVINTQPAGTNTVVGSTVVLSVGADGSAPLAYQWTLNGVTLPNVTNSTLTFSNISASFGGSYVVTVTNLVGSIASLPAVVVLSSPPTIVTGPQSAAVGVGTDVSFSVNATGTPPLSYQWFYNGSPVLNATAPVLDLGPVNTAQDGNYLVVVSNAFGSMPSAAAGLSVFVPPTIAVPPQPLSLNLGSNVSFSVTAAGTPPFGYQWLFNGFPIPLARLSTYSFTNAQTNNAGLYSVVVSNPGGSITSPTASLLVNIPPAITNQPTNVVVSLGTNVDFVVGATGTAPLTYQWMYGTTNYLTNSVGVVTNSVLQFANIPFGTNATLSLPYVDLTFTGVYAVVITNVAGSVTSTNALLTVNAAPLFTQQPNSQTVLAGDTVSFIAAVSGVAPLALQWQFNGTNLLSQTNSTLSLTNVVASQAGSYMLRATNSLGTNFSQTATLVVVPITPPVITTQPQQNETVQQGGTAQFVVTAASNAPLTYQWFFGSTAIAGATNSVLIINNCQAVNAGLYYVIVANKAQAVNSGFGFLTVLLPPSITANPISQTVAAGSSVTLTVGVTGTLPFSYQWNYYGVPIGGATNASLTLPNLALNQTGQYSVTVVNLAGSATSQNALLTVLLAPSISQGPASQSVLVGASANFSVVAGGSAPLLYQWLRNGNPIGGATGSSYSIASVAGTDAGSYSVTVSNSVGVATSSPATLSVSAPAAPVITVPPQPQSVVIGSNATFSVTATGVPAVTYQWQFGGTNISGANSASLVINAVQPANSGPYTVVVTNPFGTTNATATLDVQVPPHIVTQPSAQQAIEGNNVTFSVVASGTDTLNYQWFYNNTNVLTGENDSSLILFGVTSNQAGVYTVVVSNPVGVVGSVPAPLLVSSSLFNPPATGAVPPSGFVLSGAVEIGKTYRVQFSTDLIHWTDVTSFFSSSSAFQFVDTAATGSALRFYRIVTP